ncbi:urea transporter [Rhodococcus sp. CH91]|uniref:urea transporter n=1 Tax=Rhodococcus sp. CH91 TaxID=2910256 RepID=UPI001F4A2411|nr:urea transporter [Rhodococcus sp. CH91]
MTTGTAESHRSMGSPRSWLVGFGHGPSQIYFQANIYTTLLIMAAFVVASWQMAVLVAIGCVAQTLTGWVIRTKAADLIFGMQGFSGALVGAATFATLGSQWFSYPIALVGGALAAPVTWLVDELFTKTPLKTYALPSTTAPFCIVATIIHFVFERWWVESSQMTIDSTVVAFFRSLLTNVSEVVLVDNVWAGALILIGLFVANWKVGLAGLLGSVVGTLCALALGESLTDTGNGLSGYSGVLTAIALSVTFLKESVISWVLALLGTIVTAVVTLVMHDLDVPTYTWPYILTTWVFLVIAHYIPAAERP